MTGTSGQFCQGYICIYLYLYLYVVAYIGEDVSNKIYGKLGFTCETNADNIVHLLFSKKSEEIKTRNS